MTFSFFDTGNDFKFLINSAMTVTADILLGIITQLIVTETIIYSLKEVFLVSVGCIGEFNNVSENLTMTPVKRKWPALEFLFTFKPVHLVSFHCHIR